MDDIQSWWEVPSIAHFCSLFRAAFNLLDFDIEELEEALLTDGTEDPGNSLLQDLIVRLLCGCLGNNDISTFNFQMFLRRLFRQKCQEYGRENPFNTDIDFQFLPLRTKVEILQTLCDFRLDADDVLDLLKNLEADSLRVEPLGYDENNSTYWYFYGTRLYREDYPNMKKKAKDKKRKNNQEKKRNRHGKPDDEDSDDEVEENLGESVWQVICYTQEDWDRVTASFQNSSSKVEQELYITLAQDFLPEIPRLFAEKERLQKKRLYLPRRHSSRIDRLKRLKEEEEKKLQIKKNLDTPDKKESLRERKKNEDDESTIISEDKESLSEFDADSSLNVSDVPTRDPPPSFFVGRQTNNSLSSATGKIVIQNRRTKIKTSQIFRQSEEDLQTGLYKILEFLKNHEDAWPFAEPVDEQYAPRYYSIISRPMDLGHMEDKLDRGEYLSLSSFKKDFQLIVDNCRRYNGSDNEYTEMASNLQVAFEQAASRYLESDVSSDEEIAIEFRDSPIPSPLGLSSKETTETNILSQKSKKRQKTNSHKEEESSQSKFTKSPRNESKSPIRDSSKSPSRSPSQQVDSSSPPPSPQYNSPPRRAQPSSPRMFVSSPSLINRLEKSSLRGREKSSKKRDKSPFRKRNKSPPKKSGKSQRQAKSKSPLRHQELSPIRRKAYSSPPRQPSSSRSPSPVPSPSLSRSPSPMPSPRRTPTPTPTPTPSPPPVVKNTPKKRKKGRKSSHPRRRRNHATDESEQDSANIESDIPPPSPPPEPQPTKKRKPQNIKDTAAIEALEIATEQTLKDINKWLDGTPRFSEYSSRSPSPIQMSGDEADSNNKSSIMAKIGAIANLPFINSTNLRKDLKGLRSDRRSGRDSGGSGSKHRKGTIDRLQPGKSKGNLLAKAEPATAEVTTGGKGEGTALSLGSVLAADILRLDAEAALAKSPASSPSPQPEQAQCLNSTNTGPPETSSKPASKPSNLSAWFKAFGAPKRKESSGSEEKRTINKVQSPSRPLNQISSSDRLSSIQAPPTQVQSHPLSRVQPPPTTTPHVNQLEEDRPSSNASSDRPGSSLGEPGPPVERQRKASTGSSISERSSFSQDPDSADLGGFPAPYPSPLHHSPDEPTVNETAYPPPPPPINGTLRVGFYQDTTATKPSPEKTSPLPYQSTTNSQFGSLPFYDPIKTSEHLRPKESPPNYASSSSTTITQPKTNVYPVKKRLYNEQSHLNESSPQGFSRTAYTSIVDRYPSTLPMYSQSSVPITTFSASSPPSYSQASYSPTPNQYEIPHTSSGESLQTPPESTPSKPVRKRKTKAAFQQYQKDSETTATNQKDPVSLTLNQKDSIPIALKTASVVPGSAFNFGPAPPLALYAAEKDAYSPVGYLEEYRSAPSSSYYITPEEKNSAHNFLQSGQPTSFPFGAGPPGPPPPTAPTLYQQYLRHQEAVMLHPGLLGAPPPGFSRTYPPLDIRQQYDSINRPAWP